MSRGRTHTATFGCKWSPDCQEAPQRVQRHLALVEAQTGPRGASGGSRVTAVNDARSAPRSMGQLSWDEAFSRRYEEWSAHMTADIAFYVALARQPEGPLVELAVGNGRVAIPVAQATGRPVFGVDSSPAMLEQARSRAREEGVELDLREGDMRDFAIDEPAALIYCPFRALLHLPTWADRRRTFKRVAARCGQVAGSPGRLRFRPPDRGPPRRATPG
jgi:SAM-dependent methyltransferase